MSTYRWLSSFGVAMIISGVTVLMAYAVLKVILTQLAKNINIDFSLSPDIMLKIGIIEVVFGIIFIVVKNVIEKQIIKRNNQPALN